jgi:phage-related protein
VIVGFPPSRPMPSIGKGVHELRVKAASGEFRVIYWLKIGDAIYLVHAFSKKSQKTARQNIETALMRIKKL